ncbi:unnamed protein product [Prunus armeniaca]|uniref:Uncharacterized protein n=1 Tax=Prunus armeniaca TaxID=36596 RepID=A0A6J5TD65_PRUAR|nr:unnamed protein product [Prunus armeniaca]
MSVQGLYKLIGGPTPIPPHASKTLKHGRKKRRYQNGGTGQTATVIAKRQRGAEPAFQGIAIGGGAADEASGERRVVGDEEADEEHGQGGVDFGNDIPNPGGPTDHRHGSRAAVQRTRVAAGQHPRFPFLSQVKTKT